MEPLKNMFNPQFINDFSCIALRVIPNFDAGLFFDQIFDESWNERELKDRIRHISSMMHKHLPLEYEKAIAAILKILTIVKEEHKGMAFQYMILPDFIEQFGLDHLDLSLKAMEEITQFISCEFAVRPFLIKYPKQVMQQMLKWSMHEQASVRRFASEGCRPRLPWAMALPALKNDPTPILPILEKLKNDESEFVRKSVANNLNDLSKDHPDLIITIAKRWQGASKETDWIIKHGCRTLLKQGNTEVLELFGVGTIKNVSLQGFQIQTPIVEIGAKLDFTFQVLNENSNTVKIRLEYGIYYLKANGTHSRKIYKISEKDYAPNSVNTISKSQSFRVITTRKFHRGEHRLSVIVNGKEMASGNFELS